MMKLVMGLHYKSSMVMEFIMELHCGSPKEGEASVEASPHGFLYLCEPKNGRFLKKNR